MNQKKKLSRKVISYVLALVMVFSILTGIVPGMVITAQAAEATTLTAETTTWVNGDYVVPSGGVIISGHITVKGIVNLTLTEGATLTANMGITLGQNARLNVSGKGAMVVNGSNGNTNSTVAGTGKLVLKSGTLTATGGNGQSFSSGNETTGNTGGVAINGTVAVNGGTLAATGGNGGSLNAHTIFILKGGTGGAAIGGAVTINGGTVTATGGNGGSITITNWGDTNKGGNGGAAIGGAVTINGGTLTATKGDNGTLNIKNGSSNYAGTGSAGYDGTLTLGANVKLYEGTDNTGTVLDDNDSDSRVYSGEKKANMYAYGSDVDAVADKSELNDAITVAEKWYGRIKNNTDYIDIASALKTAIDTAKAVADNDEAGQDVVDTATQNLITAILSAEASISMGTTWEEETYVVPIFGETIAGHITVTGTVNLILIKGATLTANAGITLNDGATLNVSGDGAMVINGTSGNTNSTVAGSGVLVLKSGTLTATGGTGGSVGTREMDTTANAGGAAINGAVTVKGGTLTATGGTGGSIGNYSINCTSGAGGAAINGAVTVNGGTLTATDGTKGTSGNAHQPTLGAGGAGYSGTLTLGKGVKLYEGTEANEEKLLDGNDSASHVYEGKKKAKMFAIAEGPDKTALDDAITAAVTLYDSIKNNNDYIDIASTLKTAIDAAKGVAESDEADQDAIDAAKTAITTAKTTAETAKKNIDDTKAANAVIEKINALPLAGDVTASDKSAIEAARKAYDALTADQKAKVTPETLKNLEAAEKALAAAEKKETDDTDAAKKVTDAINALPASDKVATTDKATIEAARKAYDALTAEQKAKVTPDTLKKLEAAEKALATAEKKETDDTDAAKKVNDAIGKLPASDKVATTDKAAIEAARKAAKELAAAKEEAQAAMNEQVTVTQKGSKFTVKWKKSSAADGYYVYAQYCGKKITKPAKTIAKNTTTKTTITKINQKRQFRVYVVPYKIIDGKKVALGKSTVAHLVGAKSTKYSNVKKLTLTKSKYTVKVGKTAKIKAKVTLVNKNKKHIPKGHGAKFRYKSSDTSIATVDKNGKIKGIKKGTCTIYVYSINGLMKKAKVTIK